MEMSVQEEPSKSLFHCSFYTKKLSDCVHPYPCGWLNDPQKACGCAPAVVTKYQKRISGSLLDKLTFTSKSQEWTTKS